MGEQNQDTPEELKKEIDQIKADYNKAKSILSNIQEFSKSFEDLKNKVELASSNVNTNSDSIATKKKEVDDIKNQASVLLNDISANLEKVKGNIASMQEAYTQFSEIKGNITGRSGEIENLLKNATGLKDDVEKTKLESQKVLESIKVLFEDVQKKVQDMQSAFEGFLQIKGKIDDEKTGLKAAFDVVQDLKTKSESIHKEIQSFRDESKQILENIKKNKEDSENFKKEISENLNDAQKNKKELSEIVSLITDTGFANAFQARAKKLYDSYRFWGGVVIGSIIILVIVLLYLFRGQNGNIPEINFIIYRMSLASPLIFLFGFAVSQYGKERDLNEKYEFKAVTATVIRNHIRFLINTSKICNDSIGKFSSDIFTKIYTEPFDDGSKLEKRIRDLENMQKKESKNKAVDEKKIITSIKELKALIPDEKVLKDILSLLINK